MRTVTRPLTALALLFAPLVACDDPELAADDLGVGADDPVASPARADEPAAGGRPLPGPGMLAEEPDPVEIVGGAPAAAGEFPFAVSLRISGPSGTFSCGGSLVAPQWVMTAAHCVTDISRPGLSLPGDFTATIGRTKLSNAATGEVRSVTQVVRHPRYDTEAGTADHDVALLALSAPSSVAPVDLAAPYGVSDRALWKPGAMTTVIGWGRTCETCGGTDDLMKVDVPIVDDAVAASASNYGASFDRRVHVAAGYTGGTKDACYGDSGGPLLAASAAGWQQVGVVSWGLGCARADKPGVYTRIGAQQLHRWVRSVIHETPAVGDVNGDGRDDIITFTHGDAGWGPLDVYVALSSGAAFGASQLWADWWAHRGHLPAVGDFNGDGRADIWAFTETDAWVALSTGAGFNGGTYVTPAGTLDRDDVPVLGDVDGDGRDDLVIFSNDDATDVHVVLSTGTGFGPKTQWHDNFAFEGETPAVVDIDGDGRDDIVLFSQGMWDSGVWVARSTGAGFGPLSRWSSWFGLTTEAVGVGNFNGDNRGDVITFTRNAGRDVYVGLSSGAAFTAAQWHADLGGPLDTLLVGDPNGDGRDDVVVFAQTAGADVFVSLSSGASFGAPALWHGFFAP